jgi:hypothetical protein
MRNGESVGSGPAKGTPRRVTHPAGGSLSFRGSVSTRSHTAAPARAPGAPAGAKGNPAVTVLAASFGAVAGVTGAEPARPFV